MGDKLEKIRKTQSRLLTLIILLWVPVLIINGIDIDSNIVANILGGMIAVLLMIMMVHKIKAWRCPNCKAYLGKNLYIEKCPYCKKDLVNEENKSI